MHKDFPGAQENLSWFTRSEYRAGAEPAKCPNERILKCRASPNVHAQKPNTTDVCFPLLGWIDADFTP